MSDVCEPGGPGPIVELAVGLLHRLSKEGENLFFSPTSIAVALAMTLAGAEGETKEEMLSVLFTCSKEDQIHDSMHQLIEGFNGKDLPVTLHTANRLYAMEGMAVEKAFTGTLTEKYASSMEIVNFANASEQARQSINDWVAKTTKEKIKDLIAPGVLDALTRMVIVNAIYFKGDWAKKFNEAATMDKKFHLTASEDIDAKMMRMKSKFRYVERDSFQAIQLPYKGESLVMLVLLPKKVDGLGELVKGLTAVEMNSVVKDCRSTEVEVELPRFKLEAMFNLTSTLSAMGATKMFSEKDADFTRITREPPGLYVSHVIHKAFVEVNEEGSEAAAATAVVMTMRCSMPMPSRPPPRFIADHPFLFAIVDTTNATLPLFLGSLCRP